MVGLRTKTDCAAMTADFTKHTNLLICKEKHRLLLDTPKSEISNVSTRRSYIRVVTTLRVRKIKMCHIDPHVISHRSSLHQKLGLARMAKQRVDLRAFGHALQGLVLSLALFSFLYTVRRKKSMPCLKTGEHMSKLRNSKSHWRYHNRIDNPKRNYAIEYLTAKQASEAKQTSKAKQAPECTSTVGTLLTPPCVWRNRLCGIRGNNRGVAFACGLARSSRPNAAALEISRMGGDAAWWPVVFLLCPQDIIRLFEGLN